jgi:Na+/proline symporter
MQTQTIVIILSIYFSLILAISYFTSKNADNKSFFVGNKQSPWWIVAIGMIGTSISGVTFISVPGQVGKIGFAYFQMVLGYLVGYLFIGLVLMPLYYKLNLTSIYTYLEQRFGNVSYKTGASFFLLSRTLGSAARLYLASLVFQAFVFDALGIPFLISVAIILILIYIYTYKGGIKTIIYTDTLLSIFLIVTPILSVYFICKSLNLSILQAWDMLHVHQYNKIFYWNDFALSKTHFFKQFIGGALIATAMTGLDQDLMQKNISCKNIGEAQKNMFSFVWIMLLVNFVFLFLGGLLYLYVAQNNITMPLRTDLLYPTLALQHMGTAVGIMFILGLTAAAFASSDSAITSLTTSFCVDFLHFEKKEENKNLHAIRNYVHIGVSVVFMILIYVFWKVNNMATIDLIFKIASYTYGPLLGMFLFGLFTNYKIKDNYAWIVCVIAPILAWIVDYVLSTNKIYVFGNELLFVNGLFTFIGFWIIQKRES